MGRLREAPKRLASIPTAAPAPRQDGHVAEQEAPWRTWYKTKRWQDLRREVFKRDGYRCQRTGVICSGKYPADDSPTANHKRPHRGDPALFWDIANIETVTKGVHDKDIQVEEQASRWQSGTWS